MWLKKKVLDRVANSVFFSLIVLVVALSVYSFFAFQDKINFLESSIVVLKDSLQTADVFGAVQTNLQGVFHIYLIQLICFFVITISLVLSLRYLAHIYLIEKRNSLIDPLTGLYNRRAIFYGLKKEMEKSDRYKHSTSVAMFDLDFFKRYNDSMGHVAGDKLLKRFSDLLRKIVRDYDLEGRYGGEEFILVFPETKLKEAVNICERIRKNLEKMKFLGMEKMPFGKITCSIGVAEYDGKKYSSTETFIQKADHNLYRAKETGRNRVVFE